MVLRRGLWGVLTATVTATSADEDPRSGRVFFVVGLTVSRDLGCGEGVAEGFDGLVLEAEADVGVNLGGNGNVGMAEQRLDDNEVDALFQEQGGAGVAEVVEADSA
jgi:hypothetical protein